MPWFQCFIRGEDFPGVVAGVDEPIGFFTARFVEVPDIDRAEEAAVEQLRSDPRLKLPSDFQPDTEAKVFVEEMNECDAGEVVLVA